MKKILTAFLAVIMMFSLMACSNTGSSDVQPTPAPVVTDTPSGDADTPATKPTEVPTPAPTKVPDKGEPETQPTPAPSEGEDEPAVETTPAPVATPVPTPAPTVAPDPVVTPEPTPAPSVGSGTLADKLCAAFSAEMAASGDMMAVMEALAQNSAIQFSPAVFEMEEGYLAGFSEEIYGFKRCIAMAPMIGTIPFVSYVFEVDNPQDFVSTLSASVMLNWNICTAADEYKTAIVGNYVFIVMAPFE